MFVFNVLSPHQYKPYFYNHQSIPMKKILCSLVLVSIFLHAHAQLEKRWLKHQVATLTAPNMHGRGYVEKGKEHASAYIQHKFTEFGLVPVGTDTTFVQRYTFPINTFPGIVSLSINKKEVIPGEEFIVDAASTSFTAEKSKIRSVNLEKIKDSVQWSKQLASFTNDINDKVWILDNLDSLCKELELRPSQLVKFLPKGCYIVPQHGKLIWDASTDTMAATVLYVEDSVLPRWPRNAEVNVHSVFIPASKNDNIIGEVPGEVKDSFIVFTAHYDHLGMMGRETTFPGASDNASGTAMMLHLANYFAANPQHYTMVFIAFSGEEPGLLGSDYFVNHPLIPLDHIKFLTNVDIMGDATDGITVVNATEFPAQFSLLQELNTKHNYLTQVKSRGKAANSDHYHFTERGVPSFFIYSNGGKGYYHDVFDNAKSLSMKHIDDVAKLLIDFTKAIK